MAGERCTQEKPSDTYFLPEPRMERRAGSITTLILYLEVVRVSPLGNHLHHRVLGVLVHGIVSYALPHVLLNNLFFSWFIVHESMAVWSEGP